MINNLKSDKLTVSFNAFLRLSSLLSTFSTTLSNNLETTQTTGKGPLPSLSVILSVVAGQQRESKQQVDSSVCGSMVAVAYKRYRLASTTSIEATSFLLHVFLNPAQFCAQLQLCSVGIFLLWDVFSSSSEVTSSKRLPKERL